MFIKYHFVSSFFYWQILARYIFVYYLTHHIVPLLVSSSDSGSSGLVSRPSISIPINIEREDRLQARPRPGVTLDEELEVTR